MYYCHTRYYVPKWFRWLNSDNVEYLDTDDFAGINLFVYCGNNPVIASDPDGTFNWKSFGKGLAIFAGAVLIVAAVALITVASGGTALPVIIGAAIGAGVSGGISVGTQIATTGTVDPGQFLTDVAIGGVLGAFGGSALNVAGMAIAGGLTGFGGSVAGDWVEGQDINWVKATEAGALGVLMGFAGGAGAQYGRLGARQAALATKKQILSRYENGGYRNFTNFEFGLKSNYGRIQRATSILNRDAIHSLFFNNAITFELNVYRSVLSN